MADILLVDDNRDILDTNEEHLESEGYNVTTVESGIRAVSLLNERTFDCIILDIMLPDIDGFTICRAARSVSDTPIIFLSALDATEDKVKGLLTGADDYITKPYSLQELSARIVAQLRRENRLTRTASPPVVSIDKGNRLVQAGDSNVALSQKEFELFMLMYKNQGRIFSKEELFAKIWGDGSDVGTVAVHIFKLRRKLDSISSYIGTIRNDYRNGYLMEMPQ